MYQDPLHEHEIPLPTIRLPRQNRFLKDLRPVDDLDELLCGVSGDLYCRQVRIGEQQSQRTQVHADVGAQLKMDAGGCFAVNARANSARLVASSRGPRFRSMYSRPKFPAQKFSCGVAKSDMHLSSLAAVLGDKPKYES